MSQYRIEYDNDTGPNDEGFTEWWTVVDEATGNTLCKCDEKEHAEMIRAALAARATPPPAPVLSDAEIDKLYYEYSFNTDPNTPSIVWRRGFARAIEQAIGRASRGAA